MPTLWLILSLSAPAQAAEAVPCPCEPVRTQCVATAGTKTRTRTCYRCRETVVCLPFKPKCEDCGDCGRPRVVRVLIKRFVKEEKPERKCEPVTCPPAKGP